MAKTEVLPTHINISKKLKVCLSDLDQLKLNPTIFLAGLAEKDRRLRIAIRFKKLTAISLAEY